MPKIECSLLVKTEGGKTRANTYIMKVIVCSSLIESWILDSGTSFRYTSNRNMIERYVRMMLAKVYLDNDESLNIIKKGCGDVRANERFNLGS